MAKRGSSPRILIVCDEEANRTLARRRFTRVGYEVMEAADSAKALSLAAMIPFQLAILDLEPEESAELLRRIRENRSRGELPVLVVAERAAGEDGARALELGADDCIARPIDFELAYARVAMLIGVGQRPAEARSLETNLVKLQLAVERAENTAAAWRHLGHDARTPLTGVLRAAHVLTRICVTDELKPVIKLVEASTATLDRLLIEALDHPDRRGRPQRDVVRVLSADDDAENRLAMRAMLDAAETPIELVEAPTGLQAALAAESSTFDLILVNVATAEAMAGIRAIRRNERQAKARRIPILAIAAEDDAGAAALEAGADVYMRKPVSAEGLLTALTGAINRQSDVLSAVA